MGNKPIIRIKGIVYSHLGVKDDDDWCFNSLSGILLSEHLRDIEYDFIKHWTAGGIKYCPFFSMIFNYF